MKRNRVNEKVMGYSCFVTGTDTGVGKTLTAAALLCKANQTGLSTAAIKPVAAGCHLTKEGLRNEDALILQQMASIALSYEEVNPIALEPAIAPHIAAAEAGIELKAESIAADCRRVQALEAQLTLIEGAGGWRVPLNRYQTFADIPRLLNLPVVLVVGIRLGCINHALLTAEAVQRDGLQLAGWVANQIEPVMTKYQENLAVLVERLPCALLGEVPFLGMKGVGMGGEREAVVDPTRAAVCLSLPFV